MFLKAAILLLTAGAVLWRRRTDDRLPWTVLLVLAGVFISRVYWRTAPGTLRAEQLACLLLFGHCLVDLLSKRQWPRLAPLPLLLLAMLPWMALGSWLASPDPAASLRKSLIYFPYLAGFAALHHFLDSRERVAAAWDFLTRFGAGMMAFSLAGYFLFFAGLDLGMVRVEYGVVWLRGSLVNPNLFGAAAGLVLVATLVRFLAAGGPPPRRSLTDLGAMGIAAASLVVSFSRAAWLLTLLAAIAAFLFTRRRRCGRTVAIAVLVAATLLTALAANALSMAYGSRLKLDPGLRPATAGEFGEPVADGFWNSPRNSLTPTSVPFRKRLQDNYTSLRWRFLVSAQALRDWKASPIIGRGTDSLMLGNPGNPHVYIPVTAVAILHDWGMVALALYAAFLIAAGFGLWKKIRPPAPFSGLYLAIFLVFSLQALHAQVATAMQLASFWVLAAIFATAAGAMPAPEAKTNGADGRPKKMRIGIDGRWFFRGNPSGRVVVRNLARHLAEHHPENEYYIFLPRSDRRRPFPWLQANVHTVFLPDVIGILSVCVLLPWKAARLGLDACLSFNFTPLAGRYKKIVWINDVIFLEYPEFFTWKERLYFWPIRPLARLADRICTVSRCEMERMARLGFAPGPRIAHVPDGGDARYRPAADHDPARLLSVRERCALPERYLLYIGRLNIRKNIQHLLEALPLVRDRGIKLFLAGRQEGKMFDLPARIAELGLNDRVVLLGEVAEEDLPALYAMATVFCYVSFAEGFGLPPLEAMASGVPAVVSDRDSLPEVCGPAGTYVDPDRPEEIAAAIDSLLGDPDLRARKRQLGLERAGMFSWQESADRMQRLIGESLL